MRFEEFNSFMTKYYPEDCYNNEVMRDFYDKGFYYWDLDKVIRTLDELTNKLGKKPIIQMLIIELNFLNCKKGGA